MRRRILISILSVTTMAILLFAIPLGIVVQRLVDEDAALRVERQAVLAAREVPADFATGSDPVELPETTEGVILGLYGQDGRLLTGSGPKVAESGVRRALDNRVTDTLVPGSRIVAVPVAADEQVIGLIRAEQSTRASDRRALGLLGFLVAVALTVVLLGAAVGFVLAGRLARPVRRLRDAAVELGQGRFTVSVPHTRITELDEAAAALVTTGQTLDDLITRERAFSTDSSHQLRTPVAGMRAAIETELQFPREQPAIVLRELLEDIDRLEVIITELLSIARTPEVPRTALTIAEIVADVLLAWSLRLDQDGRTLVADVPASLPQAWGNPSMLTHVLEVLLDNARLHGAGIVTLKVRADPTHVIISVTDQGSGFDGDASAAAATPAPRGAARHGLGLPLARRYVRAMHGTLTIVRDEGSTHAVVTLLRVTGPTSGTPLA